MPKGVVKDREMTAIAAAIKYLSRCDRDAKARFFKFLHERFDKEETKDASGQEGRE